MAGLGLWPRLRLDSGNARSTRQRHPSDPGGGHARTTQPHPRLAARLRSRLVQQQRGNDLSSDHLLMRQLQGSPSRVGECAVCASLAASVWQGAACQTDADTQQAAGPRSSRLRSGVAAARRPAGRRRGRRLALARIRSSAGRSICCPEAKPSACAAGPTSGLGPRRQSRLLRCNRRPGSVQGMGRPASTRKPGRSPC